MQHNNKLDLCQAINMIQEENNRITIRHNKYYMLSKAHSQAKDANMEVDPMVIVEINSMSDCSSDIEMSDEEK